MQGKKEYQEQLFTSFQLSNHIPKENFYRRLSEELDLLFLYPLTEPYYGYCGRKSIDPVVFYKLCLVGYFGMRKVNTIGIQQANKVMLMAATAYNLKKYLKFTAKKAKSKAEEVHASLMPFFCFHNSPKTSVKGI